MSHLKTLFRLCLFVLPLLGLWACEELENIVENLPPPGLPAVDAIAEEEVRQQELAGLAIGIVQGGRMTHIRGYGFADRDRETPLTKETLIRWASISKTLTAIAAIKMYRAGDIDLDKDIRDYVSYWPQQPQGDITLRQLLQNTSGIPHYNDSTFTFSLSGYDDTRSYNARKSVETFSNQFLLFDPGTEYNYSTFGFILAAAAIDKASRDAYGLTFPELVRDSIAEPLGLSTLQPDYSEFRSLSPRTLGYDKNCAGEIQQESTTDVSWKLGGGGWISTPEDLTRYMEALINEEVVPAAWMDTLLNEPRVDGSLTGYGMGFQIFGRYVGHGGWQQNGRNQMYFWPGSDEGIVIMCNSKQVDLTRIFIRLANELGMASFLSRDYNLYNRLDCNDDCENANTALFAGVWRAGETDQLVRRGYTFDQFNSEWNRLSDAGYRLKDLDTWRDAGGIRRWDGIFTKGSGRHAMWRGFSQDDFNAKWQEMSDDGLRLIDLETYRASNGDRLWAGVFEEGSGAYAMFRNFDFQDFNAKWNELNDQGLRLIDIETYEANNGDRLWAGVWRAGTDSYALYRGQTTADFNSRWNAQNGQGRRLVDLEVYRLSNGELRWAGVWRAGTEPAALWRNFDFCGWQEKHQNAQASGLELLDLERYE